METKLVAQKTSFDRKIEELFAKAEESRKKLEMNTHQLEMFDLETKRIDQDM